MYSYDSELLSTCIKRDNSSNIEYDGRLQNKKLKRYTKIFFSCQCSNSGKKSFRSVVKHGGMFCQDCTVKKRRCRKA